jgi:pre-mRNA-splicing factor SYF1
VELELRHEKWDDALAIVRSAVAPVRTQYRSSQKTPHLNLTKSLRLWDLLLDLEESLGTVQTTKDAYNRAIEIKMATPMHILNLCSFLTDHKYFEESFTGYERGIELFAFPHPGAKLLWRAYIQAFLKRYKGAKVERTRELFQRCLETCPPEESSEFFMMSGEFEEEHGLTKRALNVYSAMCQKVPAEEKFTAYQLYIAKTTKYLGLTATRDIYQEAIEKLEDDPATELCQDFAKMETTLQEVERARAVLTYGAQMADPRRNPEYWKTWNAFEIEHGNEETFREMLRVKRTVEAQFSTINYNAAEMSAGSKVGNLSNEEAMSMIANREGMEVQKQTTSSTISGFVSGSKRAPEVTDLDEVEQRVAKLRKATAGTAAPANESNADAGGDDEEIDIDDVDDDDDEEEEEKTPAAASVKDVKTKTVPAAVFGGLSNEAEADGDEDKKGALERLRSAAAQGK